MHVNWYFLSHITIYSRLDSRLGVFRDSWPGMISWSYIGESRSPCGDITRRSAWVRGVSRRRWASKKVRAGLSSRDYVSMHTYVSLTLAKTPHLPIKRRKVSRIDQPPNRGARDRGGCSRDAGLQAQRGSADRMVTWPRSMTHSRRRRHVRQPVTTALACSLRRYLAKRGRQTVRELFFLAPWSVYQGPTDCP